MWYEYGRTPNQFEIDAVCVTANYTYIDDSRIGVQNFNYNLYIAYFKSNLLQF
jgi:lipocalin